MKSFHIDQSKTVETLLAAYFKLDWSTIPIIYKENTYMSRVPYSSVIGSLMYYIVFMIPDVTRVIYVVSRFTCNIGKGHWEQSGGLYDT